MKPLLMRRTKKEVCNSLPEIIENNYYVPLHKKQESIHSGSMSGLLKIAKKKFLTPMDLLRLQKLLLSARMVCDPTCLIGKETNNSPKLFELETIIHDEVIGNNRKAVIFTEWTTMGFLIGSMLERLGIRFIEFSGKVPVVKRQALIDEFRDNPECMVFLSTDAGGVGINLQHCDFLINFEIPWNPAKLNQRIGRIHRIGQTSDKINVINLISRKSIGEKVQAGIVMKQNLFDAVLAGTADAVDFSREEQNRFLNQIREMFAEELENSEAAFSPAEEESFELSEAAETAPEGIAFVDYEAEETDTVSGDAYRAASPEPDKKVPEPDAQLNESRNESVPGESQTPSQPAIRYDQLEAVLNQGLSFLNTLTAAATGKELFSSDAAKKNIEVDRETGEVVLRFKL